MTLRSWEPDDLAATGFDRTIEVRQRQGEDGVFDVDLDAGWLSLVGIHGGYMSAVAVHAAGHVDPERQVRKINTTFMEIGKTGPASVSVRELRRGRSMSTLVAEVVQNDDVVLSTRLTTTVPRTGIELGDHVTDRSSATRRMRSIRTEYPDLALRSRRRAGRPEADVRSRTRRPSQRICPPA